jgi:hypothetical protein
MRMPADQLFINLARHVIEVEKPFLFRNSRVKNDLDQHVAQLLAHVRHVIAIDGVDQFTHLVDQTAHE